MLNLERMRALSAVETYGSVSAAAEVLHVSTSAVSQQLAKLEREIGQRLLEANGRGVRLTDAAHLLVGHGRRILSLVEEAEADLEAHRDQVVGHLRLATFATAARGFLPPVLRDLREAYPRLSIGLSEMTDAYEAIEPLRRGDLDLTMVNDWENAPLDLPEGLRSAYLFTDDIDLVLPADHPLAGRERVDLSVLDGQPWISWTEGSVCTRWLRRTLRAADIEPFIVHAVEEHPTQMALVAAGLGACLIPRTGRDPVPAGVSIVRMRPRLVRRFHVLWRADADRRPSIRVTVRALREAAKAPGVNEPPLCAKR